MVCLVKSNYKCTVGGFVPGLGVYTASALKDLPQPCKMAILIEKHLTDKSNSEQLVSSEM